MYKKLIFAFLGKISDFLPFLPPKAPDFRLLLPFYHTVSNEPLPHIAALYPVKTVAEFIADLEFLLSIAEPIDLETLIFHTKNKIPFPKNVFHLSFDDGFKEIYTVIAPILKQKNIPATFFINSAFLDNQNLMFRNKISLLLSINPSLKKHLNLRHSDTPYIDLLLTQNGIDVAQFLATKQPYLTSQQVQSLHHQGFSIGAHSHSHPEYRFISSAEQQRETEKSLAIVAELTSDKRRVFSFPFNDVGVSLAFFEAMQFDCSFGCAGVKSDTARQHWQRTALETNPKLDAQQIYTLEYLYFYLRQWFGKNRIERQ